MYRRRAQESIHIELYIKKNIYRSELKLFHLSGLPSCYNLYRCIEYRHNNNI